MKAVNLHNQRELAENLVAARNIFSRIKGLLGKDSLPPGHALLIKPCNGVHTFGMRFPIDVIFLDRENRVVAVSENLRPNHLSSLHFRAASVIELPAGTIKATATAVGDEVGIA